MTLTDKFREATKHFMGKNETGGVRLEMCFCIECRSNRQWRLFGDDNGPYKFKTREERDAKLAELRAEVANDQADPQKRSEV